MGDKTKAVVIIAVAIIALLLLTNFSSSWNMTTFRQQATITLPADLWNSGAIAKYRQVQVRPDGTYDGVGIDWITVPFASPVYMTIFNNLVVVDPTPDNSWWYGLGFMCNNSNSFFIEFNAPPHIVMLGDATNKVNYTTHFTITVDANSTVTLTTDEGGVLTMRAATPTINRMSLAVAGGAQSGTLVIQYDMKPYGTSQGGNATQSLWDRFIKWIQSLTGGS